MTTKAEWAASESAAREIIAAIRSAEIVGTVAVLDCGEVFFFTGPRWVSTQGGTVGRQQFPTYAIAKGGLASLEVAPFPMGASDERFSESGLWENGGAL